jgi:hypothetical protein
MTLMNNQYKQEMEDMGAIMETMKGLKKRMTEWKEKSYPTMEEFRKSMAETEEQKAQDEVMRREQAEEDGKMTRRQEAQDEELQRQDYVEIKNHWINNEAEPWSAVMTETKMKKLTEWQRNRPVYRKEDKDLLIWNTRHLEQRTWRLRKEEHLYQNKLYDALAEGFYGAENEKKIPGYKFNMDWHSCHGWVPHPEIYKWLFANSFKDVYLGMREFWNIVLGTKGDRTRQASYRTIFWPSMGIVFIRVANFNVLYDKKMEFLNRWKRTHKKEKEHAWDEEENTKAEASSSSAGKMEKPVEVEHKEEPRTSWADHDPAEEEELDPDWGEAEEDTSYDSDGMVHQA